MDEIDTFRPTATRLMDQVRETLRFYHYAYNTEKSYTNWILKFIRFNGKRHPKDMGKLEIERFLSHLAVNRDVAAATQNQAFNAIIFLYKKVLAMDIDFNLRATHANKRKNLPSVLNYEEVEKLIKCMSGTSKVLAGLMYGSGLRSLEVIRLRVQDLDFENKQIYVRNPKGGSDRTTLFPDYLHKPLLKQIEKVKKLLSEILMRVLEKCTCLLQSGVNIKRPVFRLAGNIYFRLKSVLQIHAQVKSCDIIYIKPFYQRPLREQRKSPVSLNVFRHTLLGTVLQRDF